MIETREPLVTIVTPTLNRAAMLEATVRSVQAQRYPRVEHIIVDGGSTDETLGMLGRYAGTHGLRWISEPDPGMYHAINKGLRQGLGEIQGYLNSDDLYFPWTLDVVVDTFARHPEVDLICGDVVNINDETGRIKLAWNLPFDIGYLQRHNFGYVWQPGVFWRKRVFDETGGFDEAIRWSADLEFWLRLGAAGRRFLKVNEFLAVARLHSEAATQVHRPSIVAEIDALRAKHDPDAGRSGPWVRARDRHRRRLWSLAYWLVLIVQGLVPSRLRRGPWSRFLGEGFRISYLALVLRPLGSVGRRIRGPLLLPNRNWLEP